MAQQDVTSNVVEVPVATVSTARVSSVVAEVPTGKQAQARASSVVLEVLCTPTIVGGWVGVFG